MGIGARARGGAGRLALYAAVFAGYVVGSELAFRLNDALDLQAALFIPAGITVGAMLRIPRSEWWVVLAAAATAELVQDLRSELSFVEALGFVAANTVEPLIGALIVVTALGAAVDLARLRHVFWFMVGAVVTGPAVGATIGAATVWSQGGDQPVRTLWQWWLGDGLGALLFGSLIVVWVSSPDRRPLRSPWGFALLAASAGGTALALLASDLPLAFIVLVGVVVAGAQFGPRAVALTSVLVAVTTGICLAIDHDVILVGMPGSTAVVLVKLQFAFFTTAGLVVAAEVAERERATAAATQSAARAGAEHALVARLQRLLLPQEHVSGAHFDAEGLYEAASGGIGVGGDWYDVVGLPDGRVFVSVGDIVGRGAEAAAAMGKLRGVLSLLASESDDAGALLHRLDSVAATIPGAFGASTWVGFFSPDDGTLSYAAAGHLPGFLVTDAGSVVRLDVTPSTLVGVTPEAPKETSTAMVDGSATLVLYTDGLLEKRDQPIDAGLERLATAIRAAAGRGPLTCEAIMGELATDPRDDDTVLLVIALRRAETPLTVSSSRSGTVQCP